MHKMMTLTEVQQNKALINLINWEMTPEKAVRLYLEWGCDYVHANHEIRSKTDVSYYFVINTWEKEPMIYLIRRNSEETAGLASFPIPAPLKQSFLNEIGNQNGIYALTSELQQWLQVQLAAPLVAEKIMS
jgi:hypothetical protein